MTYRSTSVLNQVIVEPFRNVRRLYNGANGD